MAFIDYYKVALRSAIVGLKNKPVYSNLELPEQLVMLAEASFNNQGYLSALIFSLAGEGKVKVNIKMQNIRRDDGDVGVNFLLPLQDGSVGYGSAVTILNRSNDPSRIKWKTGRSICKWSTRQNTLVIQDHRNFWYGDAGRLSLAEEYRSFAIENYDDGLSASLIRTEYIEQDDYYQPTQAVIEMSPEQEPLPPYAADANLIPVEIADIANFHAHAIVLKAFDLALYQFRTTKSEFLVWQVGEKRSSTALNSFPFVNLLDAVLVNQVPILSPIKLREKCNKSHLFFSDELYQAVCVSINSGRHIIFTGLPGCGKSQLAEQVGTLVAEIFNGKKGVEATPKFVTASPSWTSGEVIGRYFPSRNKDSPLEFHPGVFLEAVKNKQCLVIDEINRANMDECFGELFTVLAGQACDLVYHDAIEDSADEDGKLDYGPVKIVPYQLGGVNEFPNYCVYSMGEGFRLIGTMNTFDRSALHQMSFALMRRFDVISVSAPSVVQINAIINDKISSLVGEGNERLPAWGIVNNNRGHLRMQINQLTMSLFSNEDGLVRGGFVGMSMVIDFLDFIVRVLNPTLRINPPNIVIEGAGIGNAANAASRIVKSAIALALVVKLIPQLAGIEGQIDRAMNRVRDTLSDNFGRVNFSYEDDGGVTIHPTQSNCFDFFTYELLSTYASTPLVHEINRVINIKAAV